MRALAVSAVLLSTIPFTAHAYTAKNRLDVAQIDNAVFEVVGSTGGSGPRDYWCAAGDYALSLGVRGNTRVYVVSGVQPSVSQAGRRAVRFTITPEAAGVTPISPQLTLGVDTPGDNLSVAAARQYCSPDISRS